MGTGARSAAQKWTDKLHALAADSVAIKTVQVRPYFYLPSSYLSPSPHSQRRLRTSWSDGWEAFCRGPGGTQAVAPEAPSHPLCAVGCVWCAADLLRRAIRRGAGQGRGRGGLHRRWHRHHQPHVLADGGTLLLRACLALACWREAHVSPYLRQRLHDPLPNPADPFPALLPPLPGYRL